jgi:hypothetical protein
LLRPQCWQLTGRYSSGFEINLCRCSSNLSTAGTIRYIGGSARSIGHPIGPVQSFASCCKRIPSWTDTLYGTASLRVYAPKDMQQFQIRVPSRSRVPGRHDSAHTLWTIALMTFSLVLPLATLRACPAAAICFRNSSFVSMRVHAAAHSSTPLQNSASLPSIYK